MILYQLYSSCGIFFCSVLSVLTEIFFFFCFNCIYECSLFSIFPLHLFQVANGGRNVRDSRGEQRWKKKYEHENHNERNIYGRASLKNLRCLYWTHTPSGNHNVSKFLIEFLFFLLSFFVFFNVFFKMCLTFMANYYYCTVSDYWTKERQRPEQE